MIFKNKKTLLNAIKLYSVKKTLHILDGQKQ